MSTKGGMATAQVVGKVTGKVYQGKTKSDTPFVSFRLSYERPSRGSGEPREIQVNCSYFGQLKYANGLETIREGDWLVVQGEPDVDVRESKGKEYYNLAVRVRDWNRVSSALATVDDEDEEEEAPAPKPKAQPRKRVEEPEEDSAGSPFED